MKTGTLGVLDGLQRDDVEQILGCTIIVGSVVNELVYVTRNNHDHQVLSFLFSFPLNCDSSLSCLHFFDRLCFFSPLPGSCSQPFGLGWDRTLPDSAFQASSAFRPGKI